MKPTKFDCLFHILPSKCAVYRQNWKYYFYEVSNPPNGIVQVIVISLMKKVKNLIRNKKIYKSSKT